MDGDADLAATVLEVLPSQGIYAAGVAALTQTTHQVATIGASLNSTFEIGSINKGITGMLYADAVARGEVCHSTRLGELFDLSGYDAANITLDELSQHRSGLPAQPMGIADAMRMTTRMMQAKNPFGARTVDHLLHDLRRVRIGARRPTYSNLGFAALGHALARAANTTYPVLVQDRLADVLKLGGFYVPVRGDGGRVAHAVQGRSSRGRAQQEWADLEYAPAGGIRADVTSMATLTRALLNRTAPGAAALTPTSDLSADGSVRIGAGWISSRVGGRVMTGHNGGTGGFSSWMGMDHERGHAIFLAAATTCRLDTIGETLLLNSRRHR